MCNIIQAGPFILNFDTREFKQTLVLIYCRNNENIVLGESLTVVVVGRLSN